MGLERYNQKRDFNKTAEPEGKVAPKHKDLIFVVQKHNASRLHYDFRLEMEGVLKSWAVPKGPSMNPADKRLAVMVEDHPYSYKNFEGSIPQGEYGGGDVIVWDNGNYTTSEELNPGETAEQHLLAGLKKGSLKIFLNGKKLKGEFALVKMHGRGENNWLLLKHGDKYANETDILKKNKSVISNYTVENISDSGVVYGQNRRQTSDVRQQTVRSALTKTSTKKATAKNASAKKSASKKTSAKSTAKKSSSKKSAVKKATRKTSTKASPASRKAANARTGRKASTR